MDVYLLGAGFSSDAGVPTMKRFLEGVKSTRDACIDAPVHRVLAQAADYADDVGLNNIEELLISAVNLPIFFDLIWAFGLTISHFSRQFLTRCQSGDNVGWYEDFANLVSGSDAQILTFNYDLILEELFWWRTACVEDYGISFDEVRHLPEIHNSYAVPVYKLHGSISWLWCMDCYYTVNRYRHVLVAAYENTRCPRCDARLIPLLIPPTFRKAVQLARPLQHLWLRADLLFSSAHRLIIGGLSFGDRDADFRQRLLAGVTNNHHLQEVILVNRDQETCNAIGTLLPKTVSWRSISGFPQLCQQLGHGDRL